LARAFIGWVTGKLLAYLKVNSAACADVDTRPVAAAEATEAVFRKWRRVILPVDCSI
jgi:hypothetical protein